MPYSNIIIIATAGHSEGTSRDYAGAYNQDECVYKVASWLTSIDSIDERVLIYNNNNRRLVTLAEHTSNQTNKLKAQKKGVPGLENC